MHRRLVPLPLRRPLASLLVCALLLTQALGMLHRVQHADGPPTVHAQHPQHAHDVLGAMFAQHDDAGDCQIFDQLSHADGTDFGFAEPGTMPSAQRPAQAPQAPKRAVQAASHRARGPPLTS